MRARVSPQLESQIHHLAVRQNRSDADMHNRLLEAGLRSSGMPAAAISPPLVDLLTEGEWSLKVPLPVKLREQLKALAAEHGRSHRRMVAQVIAAGMVAHGCDKTVVAEALAGDQA
jgi:hypothetical protein